MGYWQRDHNGRLKWIVDESDNERFVSKEEKQRRLKATQEMWEDEFRRRNPPEETNQVQSVPKPNNTKTEVAKINKRYSKEEWQQIGRKLSGQRSDSLDKFRERHARRHQIKRLK
jgi:hypothetical protein